MSREMELGIRITADGRVLVSESGKAVAALKGIEAQTQKIAQSGERMATSLTAKIGHYGTALYALKQGFDAVSGAAHSAFDTINQFEKLKGQLVTLTGGLENATTAFSALEKFAATTPYTLDQSVQAFARLKSLGLEATERSLRSFGNTASAMGKDLMQFVEAVADATTGEFERLKEFGIKASAEGDKVKFTFQGVTTEVQKDAGAIADYLRRIGEEKFGDAMQRQMEGLPGALSNLEDSVAALWRTVGDSGATGVMVDGLKTLTNVAQGAAEQYLEMAIAWNRSQDSVFSGVGRLLNEVGATDAALHFAQAAAEQRQDARDLQAQLDKLTMSAGSSGDALAELGKVQITGTAITRDHTAARRAEAAAMKEQEDRERALQSALKDEQDIRDQAHNLYRSVMTDRERIQDDEKTRLAELESLSRKAAEAGVKMEIDQQEARVRIQQDTQKQLAELDGKGQKRHEETADSFTETWKNAVKRLDDVFANFWKGLLSGSGDFMGSLKSLLTDFAAEFLHNTFTRPLTNLFSGGGTAAGAPTFSLGSLFGSGSGSTSPGSIGSVGGAGGSGSGLGGIFDVFSGASSASSLFGNLTNFVGFSDAAMNMYKLGGFGFSSTLGNFGLKAANFLGLGAGGSGALAGGFGYSPWGAVGSLGASLLGVKGGIGTSIGGALGGFGGGALAGAGLSGALGAGLSAAMAAIPGIGPILAVLGGLGGAFLGSLFGGTPKTPKASATYTLGATNYKGLANAWVQGKGQLAAMKKGASAMADALTQLEQQFHVEFGRAGLTMSHSEDDGLIRLVLGGLTVFKKGFVMGSQKSLQKAMEKMQVAALKQVADQISDAALKASVLKRSAIDEIVADKQSVHDIRLFTGEASQLKDTLEELSAKFHDMQKTAAALGMDMAKLDQAWRRAMQAQKDTLTSGVSQLLGEDIPPEIVQRSREAQTRDLYQQIKDFNQSIVDENQTAKTGVGSVLADLQGLRPKKVTKKTAALDSALAALAGKVAPLQKINPDQNGAYSAFNAQAGTLADQILSAIPSATAGMNKKKTKKITDALTSISEFARALHAADATLHDDTVERYTEAQFLEKSLAQLQKERYAFELDAVKRLKDYAESLLLSDLSTLGPEEQFRTAQGDYGSALLKAQAMDQEALANLPNLADQYLRQAKRYYASSTDYATIFDSVVSALTSLKVPGFAEGGLSGTGWAMVGERGPELVNFRSPGRVYTAEETRAALSGGGNGDAAAAAAVERLIRVQQEGNKRIIERLNAMDGRLAGLESSARLEALAA